MNLNDAFTFGKYKGLKLIEVYRGTLIIDPAVLLGYIKLLLNTEARHHYENTFSCLQLEFVDEFWVRENLITAYIYTGISDNPDVENLEPKLEELSYNIENELESYLSIGNQRTGYDLGGFHSLSEFNKSFDSKHIVGGDPQYLSWCIQNIDGFFIPYDKLTLLEQTKVAIFNGFHILHKSGGTYEYSTNFKTGLYKFPERVKEINKLKQSNFEFMQHLETLSSRQQEGDAESGPEAYGYSSWDDMAFNEAFEGDADAWDHYNQ
ncbi:hypothetical protein WG947_05175 [Pontibacter sp. H259]|uniref:hypothetical protein n=1 Tax=Pontibacter sp. H259 TaxID=3133421 RepID=UPI0030C38D95